MNPLPQTIQKSLDTLQVGRQHQILLGVSGGMDSMVLLHALAQLKYPITVTHVNYKLRGKESDGDALLVKEWCEANQVPILLKEIDNKYFALEYKLNTQLAARKIRYDWWEDMINTKQFQFVAIAHHLDDQIETFFINILRGTGMKGLQGIRAQRDFIIRPMLEISRAEIEMYAKEHDVPFRTDSSNLSDDYHRNKIRHHLIPLLDELAPGFHSRMQQNLYRLRMEWQAWEKAYQAWAKNAVTETKDAFSIHLKPNDEAYLLRWLEGKGFPWKLAHDFITSKYKNTGQVLQTETHRLSRTEKGYYFEKIVRAYKLVIPQPGVYMHGNAIFSIFPIDSQEVEWNNDPDQEYISGSVVHFPLQLREWQPGDAFQPLGMKGRRKKIQDLLVDRKLELNQKARVRLLTNDQHILWVTGIQLDERAKVKPGEEVIYLVSYK